MLIYYYDQSKIAELSRTSLLKTMLRILIHSSEAQQYDETHILKREYLLTDQHL